MCAHHSGRLLHFGTRFNNLWLSIPAPRWHPRPVLPDLSTDHLGGTRLLTDEGVNVIAGHDYLPFGEGTAGRTSQWALGGDNINQKFTGQIRDQESGLNYFNARYLAASLGRFTSPDPMNAGADLYNPQSWNAYAYVMNNPLAFIDPSGMDCVTFDNGTTGDDGQGNACPGSQTPDQINVNGGNVAPIGTWAWFMNGGWRFQNGGYNGQVGSGGGSRGGGGGNPNQPTKPQQPPKSGILTSIKQKFCSAIPDARTLTLSGGIGAVGSTQGSLQSSLDYKTGRTSFSASGGFQLGWNGVASAQISTGFVYGSSNSNRSVSYSGGTAISGYMSTSGNAREYGIGFGVSLTEGVGGGRTVSLSTPSVGNVPGLETPLDSLLILAKQVCQ